MLCAVPGGILTSAAAVSLLASSAKRALGPEVPFGAASWGPCRLSWGPCIAAPASALACCAADWEGPAGHSTRFRMSENPKKGANIIVFDTHGVLFLLTC